MIYKNVNFTVGDLKEKDFNGDSFIRCDFAKAGFENSKMAGTIIDVEGFISFGNSKGFVLKE